MVYLIGQIFLGVTGKIECGNLFGNLSVLAINSVLLVSNLTFKSSDFFSNYFEDDVVSSSYHTLNVYWYAMQ